MHRSSTIYRWKTAVWTLILTALIHCIASWASDAKFLWIHFNDETKSSTSWMAWGWLKCYISSQFSFFGSHIILQPKTGYPWKLSRVEPGQYLDGRPPEKTRMLLEEVLVRPAGGAHPVVCVGPNAPRGHYIVNKHRLSDETLNRGPDSLWSLKIPWHFS